jgi:hypothetical protein
MQEPEKADFKTPVSNTALEAKRESRLSQQVTAAVGLLLQENGVSVASESKVLES